MAGCGTQGAALGFGGYTPPASASAATEEYDGSTWTTSPGSLGTARYRIAGCGTQGAALGFGGYTTTQVANTESYDGSSWTTASNLAVARARIAGAGTLAAGLAIGGYPDQTSTEEFGAATSAANIVTVTTS